MKRGKPSASPADSAAAGNSNSKASDGGRLLTVPVSRTAAACDAQVGCFWLFGYIATPVAYSSDNGLCVRPCLRV